MMFIFTDVSTVISVNDEINQERWLRRSDSACPADFRFSHFLWTGLGIPWGRQFPIGYLDDSGRQLHYKILPIL